MARRRGQTDDLEVDPSGWIIDNDLAQFMLMHKQEIKFMCMFGYTFMHGCKVFSNVPPTASLAYKFVTMLLACTGGGILVPIFINSIPVPLCTDAYPIAIFTSFLLHNYFPILRGVAKESLIIKSILVFMYEVLRAGVVVKLTSAAGAAIPASEFSFPIFGPIFCGCLAGCGGAFLPLNKGLDPIKSGLAPNMLSALCGSSAFHLFMNTSLSDGIKDAKLKAHFFVAAFFVVLGLIIALDINVGKLLKAESVKKENDKESKKKR
mmetsp:Transcript_6690/g.10192  ORF Transcript_6690/g.10192 Transcript_6690/m.10192 type:complete len:264 (+) Transcript_6690:51-842(+)